MTWPTTTVNTTNCDLAGDNPSAFRSDILDALQKLNVIIVETPAPPGALLDYAGTAIPAGYLACDGSAVSRTTYSALFTAIGTTWGAGNGTTTFNLPDLRRKTTIGSGGTAVSGPANTVGASGGAETVAIATANLPPHAHGFTTGAMNSNASHTHSDAGHAHSLSQPVYTAGTGALGTGNGGNTLLTTATGYANLNATNIDHTHSGATDNGPGSGTAITNMQPSAVVTKIIKT